ncbi:MAG: VanW family protein [Coriobacteriales bacterium]|jgi:hypothetical protein|nr:VanW family protein [Coriobacteriales bacterium]
MMVAHLAASEQDMEKSTKRNRFTVQSVVPAVIILLCSALMSATMLFGNLFVAQFATQPSNSSDTNATATNEANSGSEQPASPTVVKTPAKVDDSLIFEYTAVIPTDDIALSNNITLAATAINGKVIQAGATFSFNETVGDTESNSSYQVATVTDGAFKLYGRGGGVAQVATALYIAAISADLDIKERHPHSFFVDYAPVGFDAALSWKEKKSVMDLVIQNSTSYPVTIKAGLSGGKLSVGIIGQPLGDGITIATSSLILGYYDASGNQVEYNVNTNQPSGNITCVVESYRVCYRNRVEESKELLSRDTYTVSTGTTASSGTGAGQTTATGGQGATTGGADGELK